MKRKSLQNIFMAIATLLIASFTLPAQAEDYLVSIGNVALTSDEDLSDIKRDAIKSGKVSYDPETRTLTLDNAVIEVENMGEIPIWFQDKDKSYNYTIILKGNGNKIASSNNYSAALSIYGNLIITGGGSAEFKSGYNCGIFASGSGTITITGGCSITSTGMYGITGWDKKNTLIIDGASVKAQDNGLEGCIFDFKEIQLKNCDITAPAGAIVEDGAIAIDGEVCTNEVVITANLTGIENATVAKESAKRGTYTISGVKTNTEFDKLPKGIYIVDGVVKAKK